MWVVPGWYSTARRVERFKRSGASKSPSDNKKNANPLFAFCLSVHGKPGNGLFGEETAGGGGSSAAASNQAVVAAAAAVNAAGASHHAAAANAASVASAAAAAAAAGSDPSTVAAGVPANWQLMQLMHHNNLVGPDGLPLQLGAYPAGLANVTVASAVDAVELNSAMQTPTRPTSRASHGGRTAGSARSTTSQNDGNSPYVNALSARRCITPPTMLALPNSPPVGFHNLRGAAAEAAKKRAAAKGTAAGGRAALKKGDPMLSSSSSSSSGTGGSSAAHSDALPLAMRVDFVQSASEEARAQAFDAMSPQSAAMAKMLTVPQSAGVAVGGSMMSPSTLSGSASTPSPQSGGTAGSLSPFSSLSPFPLPPTPSKYESPPNTTSASSTATSHATASSHSHSYANSSTFPMPSPAASGAAGAAAGHGLPPLPPTPAAYNVFLQSPLPTGRPQLGMQGMSSLAGMGMGMGMGMQGAVGGSSLFSPGVMDGAGGGGTYSSSAIGAGTGAAGGPLPTPTLGSFGSSFGLGMPSPYPGTTGSYSAGMGGAGAGGMPLHSPALHTGLSGLGMPSPASSAFPQGSPLFLGRNSSNGGPGGLGNNSVTNGNSFASVQAAFGMQAPPTTAATTTTSGGKRKSSLSLEVGAPSTSSPVPSPSNTNLRSTRHSKAVAEAAEAAAAAAAKAMPSPRNSTPRGSKKAKLEQQPAVV